MFHAVAIETLKKNLYKTIKVRFSLKQHHKKTKLSFFLHIFIFIHSFATCIFSIIQKKLTIEKPYLHRKQSKIINTIQKHNFKQI
jgi:hypothetical protein